jgi:hypothetical protein
MLRGGVRCHQIQNDHGKSPAVGIGAAVHLPGIGTPSWQLGHDLISGTQPLESENTGARILAFPARQQMGQLN